MELTLAQFTAEQVKAAYLLNFGKFVEWPEVTEETGADFHICVIGPDPLGTSLDTVLKDQELKGRKVRALRLPPEKLSATCQIAYFNLPEAELRAVLARLKSTPILTVGDHPDFTTFGGMIQFKLETERLRFKISRGAADRAGLTISSKLLQLAEVVK